MTLAIATHKPPWYIVACCPFCGKKHKHGEGPGSRHSHCFPMPERERYCVVTLAELRTVLERNTP